MCPKICKKIKFVEVIEKILKIQVIFKNCNLISNLFKIISNPRSPSKHVQRGILYINQIHEKREKKEYSWCEFDLVFYLMENL